jgi:hypothetical protein
MRRYLVSVVLAVLCAAPAAPSPAASTRLIATVVHPPAAYTRRICVYAQGSTVSSCPVTGTGPLYAVGMACYCGHSPKGIIRAVPLTLQP